MFGLLSVWETRIMSAQRFAIAMSFLAVSLAGGVIASLTHDSNVERSAGSELTAPQLRVRSSDSVNNGILLPLERSTLSDLQADSRIDVQIRFVPLDTSQRMVVSFRVTNHTETDIILKPWSANALSLMLANHELWVEPKLNSIVTVHPGEEWSQEQPIQFGVDLPTPDSPEWKLQARVFYSYDGRPHNLAIAGTKLRFPSSLPSSRRLDEVLKLARSVAAEAYSPKWNVRRECSVNAADGAWQVVLSVWPVHSITVLLEPDGTIRSHRFKHGCVLL